MAHLARKAGPARAVAGRWTNRDAVVPLGRWGRGRIVDVVLIKGDPVDTPYVGGCLVRLYRESDGALMRQTWAHPVTAVYQFLWIDPSTRYTAIAYDHEDHYRVIGANNLTLGQGVELIP